MISIFTHRGQCLRFRAIALTLRALLRTLSINAVQAYRLIVSPWLAPACRFTPTCSQYTIEAIEHYGFLCGAARAAARLLRCHPFHRGGFDPLT